MPRACGGTQYRQVEGEPMSRVLRAGLVVAFLMVSGACSSGSGGTQPTDVPPREVIQQDAPPDEGISTEGVAPSTGPASWDPMAWEATVQIMPVSMSEGEREQYYQDTLARRAQESNLVSPPSVERVRFSQGNFEYSANMASCLQEQGFPAVHEGRSYSFSPGVPLAQEAALDEAMYVCDARYMMDPVYAQDWSEAQLGLVYDYWTQYYIPCVEAHGYVVAGESPSRQAYMGAVENSELELR